MKNFVLVLAVLASSTTVLAAFDSMHVGNAAARKEVLSQTPGTGGKATFDSVRVGAPHSQKACEIDESVSLWFSKSNLTIALAGNVVEVTLAIYNFDVTVELGSEVIPVTTNSSNSMTISTSDFDKAIKVLASDSRALEYLGFVNTADGSYFKEIQAAILKECK